MTAAVRDDQPQAALARQFLSDMNETAMYAATRGAPFFLPRHVVFLITYGHQLLKMWPGPRLQGLLAPLFIRLFFILPWEVIRSSGYSAWYVLRKGVRSAPPLITAVVVVFVTSDAWRILGTGFTLRFFLLVGVFLLGGLVFLIHKNCWTDLDACADEAQSLLLDIKRKNAMAFWKFMGWGVEPAPMERPGGFGAVYIYAGYVALALFALVAVAILVSTALIIVGLILINAKETISLAGSVNIYQSYPGIVITRQLLSLSFSLGAFAAFFLVAAQHPEDREIFMKNILCRYRRSLLMYTIYCRAHDRAQEWTQVPITLKLCKQKTGEGNDQD